MLFGITRILHTNFTCYMPLDSALHEDGYMTEFFAIYLAFMRQANRGQKVFFYNTIIISN